MATITLQFFHRFAHKIKSGEKNQTVRKTKVCFDDTLILKERRYNNPVIKIVTCKECTPIQIFFPNETYDLNGKHPFGLIMFESLDSCCIKTQNEILNFSKQEGFSSIDNFFRFFKNNRYLGKTVYLIKW